ncbi:MAG: prenyltransferase/squalene oxidase repeat-containing protein [Anaerolineae bacterium]
MERNQDNRRALYRRAIERAAAWLAEQQGADGSFGVRGAGLGPFMVTPLALLLDGRPECALATLQHVKRELYEPDGRFRLLAGDAGSTPVAQYAYQPGWMAISAQLNGCFGIAYPATRHLLSFQDPASGGLFGSVADRDRRTGRIDLPSTGMAGLAFLHTGRLDEARRVGDYVLFLQSLQPRPADRLYTTYDTAAGLVTDVDEGAIPRNRNYPLVLGPGVACSSGWLFGLVIAFLSDLYRATADDRYLQGAASLFDLAALSPDVGRAPTAHKLAWGCAKLYLASGDDRHLEVGCRVADHLASIQLEQGCWLYEGIFYSLEEQGRGVTVNMTSQFNAWIAMVLMSLQAREAVATP